MATPAFALVTDWRLRENLPAPLPPWLHYGLTEYLSENGVHLNNYMLQFREQGPVMFSPLITDTILSQPPDPDRGRDREMYRRASYSAFLMVWRLVEEQRGPAGHAAASSIRSARAFPPRPLPARFTAPA